MSKSIPSSSSSTSHHYELTTTKSRRPRQEEEEDLVPVDTGLIRCVCTSTEDDGFTIQCERCLVWQHAYCVKITHASIPDHYLCDQCSKRKRPKLSKRIPISKKKLRKLDSEDDPSFNNKKKKHVKSRIISRYVHPIFREAKERWSQSSRWKQQQQQETNGPLLYDHGPYVIMDATTLLTKGVLIDTPVSNQGLFATRPIPSLRYLMEVTGDVMLKSEFKFDPINDFVILGTPLSHIMFYPTLDLCIDTRQFGNKARYIRRSCHPNAELRNVVLPRGDDKTIHLGLFARHLIEKGQEVTISWNWQRGHIAWKENMNWHHQHKVKQGQDDEEHQVIDEEEERRRKATIQIMLDRFEKEFGSCACLNKRRCLIEQLRRQVAPPKEKPIFKLPAQVNVLPPVSATEAGRRKSSAILLKPKPQIEKKPADDTISSQNSRQLAVSPTNSTITKNGGVEDSVDIDVTSNSPTVGATNKDTSDDEIVDVDGDIDIGDDLPAPLDNIKDNLPLLDDNSSDDDDNADLSSLSSLSSLSVFEESGNDLTDDEENRIKQRRKKNSSRHGKSSRSHHQPPIPPTSSSSSTPIIEKASPVVTPTVLPRKKLWMRDYLNKHVASDQAAKSPDAQTHEQQQPKTEESNKNISIKPEDEQYTTLNTGSALLTNSDRTPPASDVNNNSMDVDTKDDSMDVDDKTEVAPVVENDTDTEKASVEATVNITINEATIPTTAHEDSAENTDIAAVDTVMTNMEEDVAKEEQVDIEEAIVFDINDGDLSDASTILLDEEELRQVYRRDSVDQLPAVEEEEAVSSSVAKEVADIIEKEDIANVDEEPLAEGNIVIVDEEIKVDANKNKDQAFVAEESLAIVDKLDAETEHSTSTEITTVTSKKIEEEESAIIAEKELGITVDQQKDTPIAPQPEPEITVVTDKDAKDKIAAVVEENEKKPPVKKISLQEYLSSKQKKH